MGKGLVVVMLFLVNSLFAQLPSGTYSYKNADARLSFVISGDGQMIEDCIIKGISDESALLLKRYKTGSGEFSLVESNTPKLVYTGYYTIKNDTSPDYQILIKGKSIELIKVGSIKMKSTTTFENVQFIPE